MSQDLGQKYLNTGANFKSQRHDTYPYINPKNANLSGKYVLITGASKGVGQSTAISYARAGASGIALGARSPLESIAKEVLEAAKSAGRPEPRIVTLSLDVTDRHSVDSAAQNVSEAFDGRLSILINNAGYLSPWVSIPATGSSAYGPAKLAGLRFSKSITQSQGDGADGILAIAVNPGQLKTELALDLPEFMHGLLMDSTELSGDTLTWLGSERREWLFGRYVSANWDMEELSARKEEIVKADLLKVRLAVNTFPSL